MPQRESDENANLELVIVGGGPAGMAAALVAGRARLNTLVINAESPRNAVTQASHGFLTRDGAHPFELLEVGKQQLKKYPSVQYRRGKVESIEKTGKGFSVQIEEETLKTARVILATGYRDDLSQLRLPGIEQVYGKSMFPCPFCDGFEHADQALAVFASEVAEHFVPVVRHWSKDIVLFTNGYELSKEAMEKLSLLEVQVETGKVKTLVSEQGRLQGVQLEDGRLIPREAGFIGEDFSMPATNFAADLGVAKTTNFFGMEVFEAKESGATSVPGLYLVGDIQNGFGGLMQAAFEGSRCVQGIVHEIATGH